MSNKGFLPISRADMQDAQIEQLDFVYVVGDAYVDHSTFGCAIISRLLESRGYTVGIIAQPDWTDLSSISILGEPRLGFLVSSGNMDSMVNHYSVTKHRRANDSFTPGGIMGKRPDYATTVYCNLIRQTYKHTPIIIGGIEASLRRLAHYDYWSNKMKHSVLMDSGADLLIYGMGEHSTIAIAEALDSGLDIHDITYIPGTVYRTKTPPNFGDEILLPTFDDLLANKKNYAISYNKQYINTDPFTAHTLIEPYPNKQYVVQNPPSMPLTQMEMDDVYELPYMRTYHPSYEALGGVPAIKEVKYSLTQNRGCFGACSFCALTFHQGRIVQSRSKESLVREAKLFLNEPDFKGYIHDVGGPTANFRKPACKKQMTHGVCTNKQCLFPEPCSQLEADHSDYIDVLRALRNIPGVKKVFIRSGIRFDYLLADPDQTFLDELCRYHISGQLRVAPEHISDVVLSNMGKPKVAVYNQFLEAFDQKNKALGMDQYAVPYLMSSHPGSTIKEAIELAEYLRDQGVSPKQVQDFYPTPSTIATCEFYTGLDPRTLEPIYVATTPREKAMQRALVQYRNPVNYNLVKEALHKAHREDLIGFEPNCLILPRALAKNKEWDKSKNSSSTYKKKGQHDRTNHRK